ncbi:MAG: FGGY-family carbohydrate kinase, partial [Victivallales bacterium]
LTKVIPADEIYRLTGQPFGPGYALPSLCRIKNEEPELYHRTFKFLPWADFATYMLTGKIQTNYSLASRTLLFDHKDCRWSQSIAAAVDFDLKKLPPLLASGCPLGQISPGMSRKLGLSSAVQVVSGSHDQCAAAIGSGLSEPGTAMLGLGTYACMVITNEKTAPDSPLADLRLNIEPHAIPAQYVSFIYHGSGGALLKWLRDEMFRDIEGDDVYSRMLAEISRSGKIPVILPYFAETGPLDYAPGGSGVIAGLSLSHSRADILKAALEGIIFYFREAMEQLHTRGNPVCKLHVSGGGSESAVWRQIIADILEIPVVKPQIRECGALGAAIIAGVGTKCYKSFDEAISQLVKIESISNSNDVENRYIANFERYSVLKNTMLA